MSSAREIVTERAHLSLKRGGGRVRKRVDCRGVVVMTTRCKQEHVVEQVADRDQSRGFSRELDDRRQETAPDDVE